MILSLFLIFTAILAFSYYVSKRALQPKRRAKTKSPENYQLPYEDVYFESHGDRLHGWIIRNPRADASKIIMLIHGWESNAQGMLPHAAYLYHAGFNLFLFDIRGHGDSMDIDHMSLIRFTEDAVLAFDYISRTFTEVALFGHSMGGATAIHVASRRAEVQVLMVSSAFANFDLLNRDMLRTNHIPYYPFAALMTLFWKMRIRANFELWSPENHIAKSDARKMIAHGGNDDTIHVANYYRLLKASGEHTESLLIEEAGHRNLYEFESYRNKVTQFFIKNFKTKTALASAV